MITKPIFQLLPILDCLPNGNGYGPCPVGRSWLTENRYRTARSAWNNAPKADFLLWVAVGAARRQRNTSPAAKRVEEAVTSLTGFGLDQIEYIMAQNRALWFARIEFLTPKQVRERILYQDVEILLLEIGHANGCLRKYEG